MHIRLSGHPSVHMSNPKEPNYYLFDGDPLHFRGPYDSILNRQAIVDRVEYLSLFAEGGDTHYRGESSPFYVYSRDALLGIHRDVPQAKIIVLLRDPIERAHSHYVMLRRDGRENAQSFEEALNMEARRRRSGWAWGYSYVELSRYGRYVPRWIETFGDDNVLLLTNEEFRLNESSTIQKVLHFLDLDRRPSAMELEKEVNKGGVPVLGSLQRFLTEPRITKDLARRILGAKVSGRIGSVLREMNLVRPDVDGHLVESLRSIFASDVAIMTEFLGSRTRLWGTQCAKG